MHCLAIKEGMLGDSRRSSQSARAIRRHHSEPSTESYAPLQGLVKLDRIELNAHQPMEALKFQLNWDYTSLNAQASSAYLMGFGFKS